MLSTAFGRTRPELFAQPRRLTAYSARNAGVPKQEEKMGYGLVGILVIILLVVLIFYFVRRA